MTVFRKDRTCPRKASLLQLKTTRSFSRFGRMRLKSEIKEAVRAVVRGFRRESDGGMNFKGKQKRHGHDP